MPKVKILVVGPTGCGKTRISNFLADASNGFLPQELRSTHGCRILEFDVQNLKIQSTSVQVEVQLWDCGGDERYMACWPAIRKNVNGVIFVYSPNDLKGIKKLDLFFNYFVNQTGLSPRQCIVFSHITENNENEINKPAPKLSSSFSRISHAAVNIDTSSEKLKYDFNQFLSSVISSQFNN